MFCWFKSPVGFQYPKCWPQLDWLQYLPLEPCVCFTTRRNLETAVAVGKMYCMRACSFQRVALNWCILYTYIWDMGECCKQIQVFKILKPSVTSKQINWRNACLITDKKFNHKPGPGKTLRQLARNVGQGVRASRQDGLQGIGWQLTFGGNQSGALKQAEAM